MKLASIFTTKVLMLSIGFLLALILEEQPSYPLPERVGNVIFIKQHPSTLDSLRRLDRVRLFEIGDAVKQYQLKSKK